MFGALVAAAILDVGLSLNLWPLPQSVASGSTSGFLSSNFSFVVSSGSSPEINAAVDRYSSLLKTSPSSVNQAENGEIPFCSISITDPSAKLELGMDESYTLKVSATTASITALTTWGAIRGLDTFSQLITSSVSGLQVASLPITISDAPRFSHRGLLIDSSRHFLTTATICKIIDGMAYSKLNTLHWHLSDAEAFPVHIPSYPNLADNGAYMPDMAYSNDGPASDVNAVVAYARNFGIRVVFEIDVPGHSAAWDGYPITASCPSYSANINNIPLDPSLEETFDVLGGVISDLSSAKTGADAVFHLGGDEVVYSCWNQDSSIVSWMKTMHFSSYDQVMNYFVGRAQSAVLAQGQTPTHWQEVWEAGCSSVSKDTLFQVWTDADSVNYITMDGYRVIASPSTPWYLNMGTNDWTDMYLYDPAAGLSDAASQEGLIMGGEACMWGEHADNGNIVQLIFPRVCAVGERLWSDASQTADTASAKPRLMAQRCRLSSRGIEGTPIAPDYCDGSII